EFKTRLSPLSLWLVAALPVLILSLIACSQPKLTHYLASCVIRGETDVCDMLEGSRQNQTGQGDQCLILRFKPLARPVQFSSIAWDVRFRCRTKAPSISSPKLISPRKS